MSSPKTKDEWWDLLGENEQYVRDIIASYHPYYQHPHFMKITAPRAEQVREQVELQVEQQSQDEGDPAERFDAAVKAKDWGTLVNLMNEAWFGVPESTSCWGIPGFGALCDLCSEAWVFQEEGA